MKIFGKFALLLIIISILTLIACDDVNDSEKNTDEEVITDPSDLGVTDPSDPGVTGGEVVTIPLIPGSVTVKAANSQLFLSWSTVTGATAYTVWYNTSENPESAIQSGEDITGTSHAITGLTNGTIYYIWLKAKNSAGTSEFNNVTSQLLTITYDEAVVTGESVFFYVGEELVEMLYANSSETDIVFPMGSNTLTSTVTRRFFMGKTEVTNLFYKEVLQWAFGKGYITETYGVHNEVNSSQVKYGDQKLIDLSSARISFNTLIKKFEIETGYEKCPVVFVSWYGAVMFCNWFSEMMDGNTDNLVYSNIDTTWTDDETAEDVSKTGYRLPVNTEWEYAARYIGTSVPTEGGEYGLEGQYIAQNVHGGDSSLTSGYYWTPGTFASGAIADYYSSDEVKRVAWYNSNSDGGVKAVSGKAANQLGLNDISGNAAEWCFTEESSKRIVRGGSWSDSGNEVTIMGEDLLPAAPENTVSTNGFRLVKTK